MLPERHSRSASRRGQADFATRRSMSLDMYSRAVAISHHHDNRSLLDGNDSDSEDERRLSPLPCQEGCRDLFNTLMSPMINSVAIDRSISLTREGTRMQMSNDHTPSTPQSPQKSVEKIAEETKKPSYASRKSVRGELSSLCQLSQRFNS